MGNKHNKITNEFPSSPLDSLSKACQKGMDENMNEIKLILEQHPELINETILPRNLPLLLLACDFLRPGSQMLEYLLSNYSSTIRVNERNKIGYTALIMATMFNKVDCVKLLLEHPDIDVNAKDYHDKVTALYHAIHREFTECVKLLLKHPNIDVKDATYQALIYDRLEYVEMLVNHPNLDPHEKDKLLWHCRGKECFNFLLPYYPTLNEYEKKMALVHCLCNMWKGSLDEVEELMKEFPREILIQMRDDLSKAVHIAAGKSHNMRIFEFLFSSYSDIIDVNYQSEKYGWTILHETMKFDGGYTLTARSKDPKPLKLLLAHPNIDINRQDADGNTPLHRALYFGNENYVKILLNDPRIDLTIRDKYGRTPDEMNCSFNRKNGRNLSSRKSIFQSFKWEWIVPLVSISVVFSSIWIMRYYYKGIS